MSKKEIVILGLSNRDQRIKDAMAAFREQQAKYEACLLNIIFENPLESFIIKVVVDSHYLVLTTLQRRFLKQTKSLEEVHIYCQRITKAKETTLTT